MWKARCFASVFLKAIGYFFFKQDKSPPSPCSISNKNQMKVCTQPFDVFPL